MTDGARQAYQRATWLVKPLAYLAWTTLQSFTYFGSLLIKNEQSEKKKKHYFTIRNKNNLGIILAYIQWKLYFVQFRISYLPNSSCDYKWVTSTDSPSHPWELHRAPHSFHDLKRAGISGKVKRMDQ